MAVEYDVSHVCRLQREVDYLSMRMPRADRDVVNVNEGILRTNKLEETLVEGDQFNPATEGTRPGYVSHE